jgi:hypothetical protein
VESCLERAEMYDSRSGVEGLVVVSCCLLVWGMLLLIRWVGKARRVASEGTLAQNEVTCHFRNSWSGARACMCLDNLRYFKCEN